MRKTTPSIKVADLFSGAGGTSSGCVDACHELGVDLDLVAVNHWDIAVATHTANHAHARHLCADLESVNPTEVVPGGRLNLLVASPECTNHSNARGGKPMNDQKRASAWYIINWASKIYIDHILIENVREWRDWGPLNTKGRPIQSKKGQFFLQFVKMLEIMDYRVDWQILNAADYGEATTRHRFFLQASKKHLRKAITWPAATHKRAGDTEQSNMFGDTRKPWRAAREIIDWEIQSKSIFTRKKPLAANTLNRIASHFKKHGAIGEPFLLIMRNHMASQSVDEPIPTLTAGGNHVGLCEPFVLGQQSGSVGRAVDQPVPTLSTDGAIALVEPFLTSFHGNHVGRTDGDNRNHQINDPMPTQTTENRYGLVEPFIFAHQRHSNNPTSVGDPVQTVTATSSDFALVEPFIVPQFSGASTKTVDDPLGVVTTTSRGMGLVEPALIALNHGNSDHRSHSVDKPLPTQTSADVLTLVEPCLIPFFGERDGQAPRSHSLNDPLPAVTSHGAGALVEPFIAELRGGKTSSEINTPLSTITTKGAHHALVEPFLTTVGGATGQGRNATPASDPMGTVLTNDRRALIEPFVVPANHGAEERSHTIDKPMPTITAFDSLTLVEPEMDPFLVKFYGTGITQSIDQPIDTLTAKDRFGLVEIDGKQYRLDIKLRMLHPKELAAAMGFWDGYKFTGNREDVVKQVGNAVSVKTAKALITEILQSCKRSAKPPTVVEQECVA